MPPVFRSVLALLLIVLPAWAARAHDAGKIGAVAFANSCDAAVQLDLQRAVALLHSFWWTEAGEAFRGVLRQDPGCAIAAWGIATVAIGNPFTTGATAADAAAAQAAIAQGRAAGAKTERERGYVEAVAAYYERFAERQNPARMRSLADAFEALAKQYPEDDETQIFFALYLAATQSPSDKTLVRSKRAVAILRPLFAKYPDHPGVAHYLIHSNDYPPEADQGLSAAMCYADVAPAVPHALHMPSHIFTRVGLWQQSVATNQRAVDAARTTGEISELLHSSDYMVYADLQMARDDQAARIVALVAPIAERGRPADYARAAIPARYAIERGAWRQAAELADPDPGAFPFTSAIRYFARALGAARAGDPAGAEADAAKLAQIAASLKAAKDDYWAGEVEVQQLAATAWAAFARGDRDRALALMREAADKEDASEKSVVTPGRLVPARELLGDMLLDSAQPEAALAAYEASQVRDPRRFRGFWGVGQAAERAGSADKARAAYTQLVELAAGGDDRPELAAARAYLAAH